MKPAEIISLRLHNQLLINTTCEKPEDVVSHLVAMQAQEYPMVKWAIALRLPTTTEAAIEKAFNDGLILRTHLMRPTWHFVSPADIRWLLSLTAPRVHAINGFMYRQLELDKKLFSRSNKILAKALAGKKYLKRDELQKILANNKIVAAGPRLGYIMMAAELDGVICSGPRKGKQFTYALLDERVAPVKSISRTEALYSLVSRYFETRGPATLKDFTTWSGLTMQDAKAGVAMLPKGFLSENINGQQYIFKPFPNKINDKNFPCFLMPDYDEYGMSYKDRSALFNPLSPMGKPKFNHSLVIDGVIAGSWLRTMKNNHLAVEKHTHLKLTGKKEKELQNIVKKYLSFFRTK